MVYLLGIYIGTTAASFLFAGITNAAWNKRLDREGYRDLSKERTKIERFKDALEETILLLIPGINIIGSSMLFFGGDNLYKECRDNGISDGKIVKKSKQQIEEEQRVKEAKLEAKKKKKSNQEPIVIQQEQTQSKTKSYSEMTNEEKLVFLERERAFLLSMNQQSKEKSYNDRGAYRK